MAASELTPDQSARLEAALGGRAVVAELRSDTPLVAWAKTNHRLVRVDRRPWRSPLRTPYDGSPVEVRAWYRDHYLPFRPRLLRMLARLRGRVLVHDGPNVGHHASVLADAANGTDRPP